MKSHAPKVTNELCDKNLVTKMWVTINNNTLLIEWLSEFLKLAKIVMVSVLGSVEDKCTFSMFIFMKNKLHNRLGPNLDTIVQMFAQSFIHKKVSFIRMQSQHGKIGKCILVLPLERFDFFLSRCFYFHNMDKFGEDNYLFMNFTNIWV
jgi:hypothetical protein